MPENENADDLTARFRFDQAAASAEEATRDEVVWSQRVRDAETTLDQRRAVTRRVIAQANLMETLNVILWLTLAVVIPWGIIVGIIALVGAFR